MHSCSEWLEAISWHAAQRPTTIALADVSPDGHITGTLTWQQFMAAADARAATIAGVVAPGATMLAASPSCIDLAAWIAGSLASGVRLVLMHPRSGPGEVASVCDRVSAQVVLADEWLLTGVGDAVTRLAGPWFRASEGHTREHAPAFNAIAPGSLVLGSSGTTGPPRLVLREIASLDADARAVAGGLAMTPADVVLCVPPLCHSYGIDMLLGTVLAGATLRVMTDFDARGAARQLTQGVTVLPGVPFVFESLARAEPGWAIGSPPRDTALRLAVSAGSSLGARVRRDFVNRWDVEVGQLFGATELGTVSVSIPGEVGFDPESVGVPLPGVSFRVLDPDDPTRALPVGSEGHLAVRALSMLSGYVGGELELVDGHLLTGDLARVDAAGRLTITGRLKQLIDAGGFKVNPLEVESMLSEHPEVVECAIVPLVLSDTIQRLTALVVPRDPAKPPADSELRGFLRVRLAPIKIPRRFEMVETLPRSPLGKLLRDKLHLAGGI